MFPTISLASWVSDGTGGSGGERSEEQLASSGLAGVSSQEYCLSLECCFNRVEKDSL